MGSFAETAIIVYRLSFTDQGKLSSVVVSVWYIYVYIHIHICIYSIYIIVLICTYINKYIYKYIYAAVSNRKRRPMRFSLIRLPFAHRVEICHLSVCYLYIHIYVCVYIQSFPFIIWTLIQ